MTNEQEYEIHERFKRIESLLLIHREGTMIITELKRRVEGLFNKAHSEVGNKYLRDVILKVKAFVLERLDKVQGHAELLFDSDRFADGVDFLLSHAKGNIKLSFPWYVRLLGLAPNTDQLIDDLGHWLKGNRDMFREGIGALPQA